MRRLILPIVAVCVIVAAAVVVTVVVWPDSDSESVDDAMAVMPADAELVIFTDAAATRERLGFDDLTSASSDSEVDAFVSDSLDAAPWGGTSLSTDFAAMDDWGWNWADVEWEAEYHAGGSYATAYKLRDDLDMDAVLDNFADQGYESSEMDGFPAYSLDVQAAPDDEPPVVRLLNVVAIPDENLLLTGPDAERLLAPATDDADALADTDAAADLVDAVDAPEYLVLEVGESSCKGSTSSDTDGADDLQAITGYVAAATVSDGELAAEAVAAYDDEDAAAADVEPRTSLLENGTSSISDQPYSEVFSPDVEIESEGATVQYDLGGDETAFRMLDVIQVADVPWAYCPEDAASS